MPRPEIPLPDSPESNESLPLSPDEQALFEQAQEAMAFPSAGAIDDKARPLPPEEEWGVPGTEEQE